MTVREWCFTRLLKEGFEHWNNVDIIREYVLY